VLRFSSLGTRCGAVKTLRCFRQRKEDVAMFGLGAPELFIILAVGIIPIFFLWRIVGKTGFAPALSLLVLIP
jgi:hypothetical protein